MDRISAEHRSWNMSRIRNANTYPERLVRSLLHRMGYRFRLHRNDLPGRPDIVMPRHRAVVQVHGCYWHRHPGCKFAYTPKSNQAFWESKFNENVARDRRQNHQLIELGWKVIIVWECETRDPDTLIKMLKAKLDGLQSLKTGSDSEKINMETITISIVDLKALLDVAEGYTCEGGVDAVSRYASPEQVQQAIINAKTAIDAVLTSHAVK